MEITMAARTFFGVVIMLFVLALTGHAGVNEEIQKYFNDTASKVKATDDPVQKRKILSHSLESMMKALDRVQSLPVISDEDRTGIAHLKSIIQEYQDELAGLNGFERVPDGQLNAFSQYVVQNVEQARTITISLTTVLLIIIIILLLV